MLTATTIIPSPLGVSSPGSWWSGLSMASKIAYSVIVITSAGAVVGGFQTERPITGVVIGSAAGFMLWGMGAAVYTGYKTTQAIESAGRKISSLPGF